MIWLRTPWIILAVGLIVVFEAEAPSIGQISLNVTGAIEPAISGKESPCAPDDYPDAPLRAFREPNGHVRAFAVHEQNFLLEGDSINNLSRTCISALKSNDNPDPATFDDANWITATWTNDGIEVFAVVHSEYHANKHPGRCDVTVPNGCWYTVLTAATSTNGGRSFIRSDPPVVIASPAKPQQDGQGTPRGFINPSNIVKFENNWYFLAYTFGEGKQLPGACLFKTSNISDAHSWAAYDGHSFGAKFFDPYRDAPADQAPCKPIRPFVGYVGSIVRHRSTGLFIAVAALGPSQAYAKGRFAYSTSKDLVSWTPFQTLIENSSMWSHDCIARFGYPSLIDPSSPSRNFEDTGNSAYIYMTRFQMTACNFGRERELVRMPMQIIDSQP